MAAPLRLQSAQSVSTSSRGRDRHRQFPGVARAARRGLDLAADPEPESEVRREFEHDEVRRGLERLAVEQASVKGGARLRLIDVEQDEMRQAIGSLLSLKRMRSLRLRHVKFRQQPHANARSRDGAPGRTIDFFLTKNVPFRTPNDLKDLRPRCETARFALRNESFRLRWFSASSRAQNAMARNRRRLRVRAEDVARPGLRRQGAGRSTREWRREPLKSPKMDSTIDGLAVDGKEKSIRRIPSLRGSDAFAEAPVLEQASAARADSAPRAPGTRRSGRRGNGGTPASVRTRP